MLHDLRYGLRMLAKSPAFTIVPALSLAPGIGANTAIFSMVNVILLKPVPVSEPDRLVSVFLTDQRNPGNLPLRATFERGEPRGSTRSSPCGANDAA